MRSPTKLKKILSLRDQTHAAKRALFDDLHAYVTEKAAPLNDGADFDRDKAKDWMERVFHHIKRSGKFYPQSIKKTAVIGPAEAKERGFLNHEGQSTQHWWIAHTLSATFVPSHSNERRVIEFFRAERRSLFDEANVALARFGIRAVATADIRFQCIVPATMLSFSWMRDTQGVSFGRRINERIDLALDALAAKCILFNEHQDTWYCIEWPSMLSMQVRTGRWGVRTPVLHAENGPAVEWSDGTKLYVLNGWLVPEFIITKQFGTEDILKQPNAEYRRMMMERYDTEKFVTEAGLKKIHEDACGELYRGTVTVSQRVWDGKQSVNRLGQEDIAYVRVVNGTVEPDGTRRVFWLEVDPDCRPLINTWNRGEPQPLTATAAVASTYGLTAEEYRNVIRT